MLQLKDKTFILTGASRGIGRALARELARCGANLVLNARHAEPLMEAGEECRKLGVGVHHVSGNAADAEIASELVDSAVGLGNFHGFIHAAGVLRPGPFIWELAEETFREVMEASVVAGYQLIRAAAPQLQKQGAGLAVFFGSGAAEMNTPGIGAYCVAKAAEEHLARQLAVEAPRITTFVYRPGVVETRMQEQARAAEGGAAEIVREKFQGFKSQGELISPERTAEALVNIITNAPARFSGKIATWRDGIS